MCLMRNADKVPGTVCILRIKFSRKDVVNGVGLNSFSESELDLIEKLISSKDISSKVFPSLYSQLMD